MPPCSSIRCASARCCLTACSPQPGERYRGPDNGTFSSMRPVGNLPDEWLFRDWCTNQVHTRTHRAALRSLGCNAGKRAPNGQSNCTHFASAPEKPKAPADLTAPPVVPSASSPAAQSSRRWQAGRRNYCLLANGNMSYGPVQTGRMHSTIRFDQDRLAIAPIRWVAGSPLPADCPPVARRIPSVLGRRSCKTTRLAPECIAIATQSKNKGAP